MSILDLKSNLSNFRKPTTVKEQEKQKLKETPNIKTVYSTSNTLKNTPDIKINKVDNSTSIQVLGAKKIDYKLFSINTNRGRGIPAISTLFGKDILNKTSLFKKFTPGNIVKVSEYKEQRPISIPKESNFVKITPIGIQHISTFKAILTILKNKVSEYKQVFPKALPKISEYIDQSPKALPKISEYIYQSPRPLPKISEYIYQSPKVLPKISEYISQFPRALSKTSEYIQTLIDNKNSIYYPKSVITNKAFKLPKQNGVHLLYLNQFPPIVNGFNDFKSGATGFTLKQQTTQYLGIDIEAKTYTYPKTVKLGFLLDRNRFYSDIGPSRIFDGVLAGTKFERVYNTDKNPYTNKNSFLTNISNSLKTYAETRRSPSPLDIEYTKFNLQTASWNPFSFGPAFNQPLILRGIQREKDGELAREPQSWGFKNNFDDGLIRGGIVGSTERAIFDTIRIGKWMASPRGLLFIVKQAGLQAAAPITEADPFVGARAGNGALTLISSLANTATQHLGIRFRKDAVPFVPRTTYSSVFFKNPGSISDGRGVKLMSSPTSQQVKDNRLYKLQERLKTGDLFISQDLGGPQSVYGIGLTTIRRVVNSRDNLSYKTQAKTKIDINSSSTVYNQTSAGQPQASPTLSDITKYNNDLYDKLQNLSVTSRAPIGIFNFSKTGIERYPIYNKAKNADTNYYTLGYGFIKVRATNSKLNTTEVTNFLLNDDARKVKWIPTLGKFNGSTIQDYTVSSQHIRKKLRVPDYGKRGKDLKNPLEGDFMKVYKKDFGMIDPIWQINQKTDEEVTDFIKFMFHDLNTNERFRFRAYIENVSEDFNPEWQEVKILGRADSPYIYQGFSRNVSISFKAAALSRGDLMLMWDQLERLAKTTLPEYNNTYKMKGPLIKFTLGNWFINTPAFIKSLSYTVDNDTPWEINLGDSDIYGPGATINNVGELPMTVSVQVSMQIFGEVRPESTSNKSDKISKPAGITESNHYNKGNLYPLGNEGLRGRRQFANYNVQTEG